jgi:HKD family nuclease
MIGTSDSFSLQLQPSDGRVIDSLGQTAAESNWRSAVVCVAYATHAGVAQLVGELRKNWSAFDSARKLFVVGLDFGLTEPGALRYLASLPNTACHVHEAARTLAARLRPRPLFHPKLYAFGSGQSIASSKVASGIVGSANLTGAALTANFEACCRFRVSSARSSGRKWIRQVAEIETHAESQSFADSILIDAYALLRPKLAVPRVAPIEPVLTPTSPRAELGTDHLRVLRAATGLWTQTLKIVPNLGPGRPGNQIDLKRGARVFFGSRTPLTAPTNTPLGSIVVVTAAGRETCNLRYGDNGMDKVNLPIPGGANPPSYEHSFVSWVRRPDGSFTLDVRKNGDGLIRASRRQGTLFSYAGGQRVWGVFV